MVRINTYTNEDQGDCCPCFHTRAFVHIYDSHFLLMLCFTLKSFQWPSNLSLSALSLLQCVKSHSDIWQKNKSGWVSSHWISLYLEHSASTWLPLQIFQRALSCTQNDKYTGLHLEMPFFNGRIHIILDEGKLKLTHSSYRAILLPSFVFALLSEVDYFIFV